MSLGKDAIEAKLVSDRVLPIKLVDVRTAYMILTGIRLIGFYPVCYVANAISGSVVYKLINMTNFSCLKG